MVNGLWSAAGLLAIVMFALASGIILVMVSLLTAAPDAAQTAETTFRWSELHRGVGAARPRWYGDDLWQAADLALLMIAVIVAIW